MNPGPYCTGELDDENEGRESGILSEELMPSQVLPGGRREEALLCVLWEVAVDHLLVAGRRVMRGARGRRRRWPGLDKGRWRKEDGSWDNADHAAARQPNQLGRRSSIPLRPECTYQARCNCLQHALHHLQHCHLGRRLKSVSSVLCSLLSRRNQTNSKPRATHTTPTRHPRRHPRYPRKTATVASPSDPTTHQLAITVTAIAAQRHRPTTEQATCPRSHGQSGTRARRASRSGSA